MTGKDLHMWRIGHGYRQDELAARLGIAPETLCRYEKGHIEIPVLMVFALKGLSFTHGRACTCGLCYERFKRPASRRDIR